MLALALALVAAVIAGATRHSPARGLTAPYAHTGFNEVSVATEDIVDGQASRVVAGLRGLSYWCVQVRSNDRAVQVACRASGAGADVDLVADTTGHVLYADIHLNPTTSAEQSERQLDRVLDGSFLALWPQDRVVVDQLVQDARPTPWFPLGDEAAPDAEDQFSTHEKRTANATWSLWTQYTGQPLALRIRTPDLRDRSWPLGGEHYATTMRTATAALRAAGFTCAIACSRATDNRAVRFDEHRGQIVAAHVTLRSGADGPRHAERSGQRFRDGLPFLTPEVRTVIGQRIEDFRVTDRSWRGVLVGAPVEIRSVPGRLLPNGRSATDLEVSVGIDLLHLD